MTFPSDDTIETLLLSQDYQVISRLKSDSPSPLLVKKRSQIFVAKLISDNDLQLVAAYNNKIPRHMPKIVEIITEPTLKMTIEEYISGSTLTDVVNITPLTLQQIIKLATQLLDSLSDLHEIGILHRDITLSNIIQTTDGNYQLIDIHAARIYKGDLQSDTVHLGTIGFASPEHFGFAETDVRSDIYSLGVVLNLVLLQSNLDLTGSKVKNLRFVIEKATQIDPAQRFQTISDMQQALTSKKKSKPMFTILDWTVYILFIISLLSEFNLNNLAETGFNWVIVSTLMLLPYLFFRYLAYFNRIKPINYFTNGTFSLKIIGIILFIIIWFTINGFLLTTIATLLNIKVQ
ncbi:protein kinase domain-containing protein [Dellaglioa algida]|uniref:non-specific serine/threonine protein kinase n=1 Tax=Dellaglioa algida TaxID=105612 RepID=A0A5C6M9N3_9LACO|nr:protein kinase [Dellaglioa algida]MDK1716798.1 protein kinase [Dellaglioa algida]MDK1720577.1 protein kinase [Dellaglioa algida]MDK1721740.1 protein kinase [Dellaglioa algida]MDK1723689.1 protein kinase [Dellaglioa algida]MDK1725268.1 protein kinase [Dellaglioa algida]